MPPTPPPLLDARACHRALRARDRRFDGRFFAAVRTTGVYCRPICPAPTALLENVEFFPTAAAAQEAGYRPCLRCRPECAPGVAASQGTSPTVRRALQLIEAGALDGDAGVETLAARVGVGERQLRRLFRQHLGASPLAVAQTRRVLFARRLLHETTLPMTQVAAAAGFSSLRRFNATFRALYGKPPSQLRRHAARGGSGITLQLAHTRPFDWPALAAFLAARAIPGVEAVGPTGYRRTFALGDTAGTLEVAPSLVATLHVADVAALPGIVARLRRLLDLDADVAAIGAQLSEDPQLAHLVARHPGLRVPGAFDGFELAVRAILGQQVSVAAARRLAGRLVAQHGRRLDAPHGELTHLFPRPARLAGADPAQLGVPRRRGAALVALAKAVQDDPGFLEPGADPAGVRERLLAIPGVGPWTAEYVALRVLREPDALPASDLVLLRASGARTEAALLARAEAWRPWRGYAAQHLWTAAPRVAREVA
jgi:AraC family transcriptional regulator of adaptative response / DNA-3-methyladenine glycosylase II